MTFKPGDPVLIRGVVEDVDFFDGVCEVGVRIGEHSVYYFKAEYVELASPEAETKRAE
jgi:hypothetical protein